MKLSNQVRVAICSAVCQLGLVIVLKNILQVPAETLSRNNILYGSFYSFIVILFLLLPDKEKTENKIPLHWYLIIIGVTLAIIALYAL